MLFVLIRSPDGKATTRNFVGPKVRIGRTEPADLVLDDPAVSTAHAELVVEGRVVEVRDLSSTNGTKLNSLPITRAVVKPEDTITVGEHRLQVELIEETVRRVPGEGETLADRVAWLEQEAAVREGQFRVLLERLQALEAAVKKLQVKP